MAGHTPGPWTIEKHGDGLALFAGADANRHGFNLVYLREPDWNWAANARLIAAAPELLAEVIRLREIVGRFATEQLVTAAELADALESSQSAIRKATHD